MSDILLGLILVFAALSWYENSLWVANRRMQWRQWRRLLRKRMTNRRRGRGNG